MKPAVPRNLVASVANRLLERARRVGEDYQYLLLRYAVERLMYRLSQSAHAEAFVVKGAMMFLVWAGSPYRPTKDLDLLAVESASIERLAEIFRELCAVKVVDDALVFLPESVTAEAIREDAAYQGVRVKLAARLGKIRLPLQVDIGFGDAITPKPQPAEFPPLLDFPAPRLRMYARETSIAEKFEAMVTLDMDNSRMKDFYDIWVLSREFEFEGATLGAAIRATFKRRRTELAAAAPVALTDEFATNPVKVLQWQAFVKRGRFKLVESNLAVVVGAARDFLMPVVTATASGGKFNAHWPKGGPWQPLK
jgi:hypothetical protein